ncbi:MAG: Arc family DNA-binding protein [Chitinophagales bacterium]
MPKENKKPFVLRISPDILKAVEKWAADDFRSVNGQIEFLLNDALKKAGRINTKDKKQ